VYVFQIVSDYKKYGPLKYPIVLLEQFKNPKTPKKWWNTHKKKTQKKYGGSPLKMNED
jgi:hypothetical protein